MNKASLLIATICVAASLASAAGAAPEAIPAGAQWVLHVDVSALTKSELANGVMNLIAADDSPIPPIKARKATAVWDRLHNVTSVTIYGETHVDTDAVLLAKLTYRVEEAMMLLGIDADSETRNHGGHKVYTFIARPRRDRAGGTRYACFYDATTIVASGSLRHLGRALDVLDGKAQSLTSDHALTDLLAASEGSVALLAGRDVRSLVQAAHKNGADLDPRARRHARFLRRVDEFRLEFAEREGKIHASLSCSFADAEQANRITSAVRGLVAMALLKEDLDPDAATVLQTIEVSRDGAVVSARGYATAEMILKKARAKMDRRAAGAARFN